MSLYHLGDIATDVHTPTFHRYLEHLGRNALQTTHIIQASSNSTANATHSSPACALRKTAHSHNLHGIANRSIVASRVVLHSCIRRTVKHTSNALAHHSRTCHTSYSSPKSGICYSCCLCHAIAEHLSCNSCASLASCTKYRSISNKTQCSACYSCAHVRVNIWIFALVGHCHSLLSILSLLLRHHAH